MLGMVNSMKNVFVCTREYFVLRSYDRVIIERKGITKIGWNVSKFIRCKKIVSLYYFLIIYLVQYVPLLGWCIIYCSYRIYVYMFSLEFKTYSANSKLFYILNEIELFLFRGILDGRSLTTLYVYDDYG